MERDLTSKHYQKRLKKHVLNVHDNNYSVGTTVEPQNVRPRKSERDVLNTGVHIGTKQSVLIKQDVLISGCPHLKVPLNYTFF